METKTNPWIELAKKQGYEGAGVLLPNAEGDYFFLITKNKKTGKDEAEFPGGKIDVIDEEDDVYMPELTAMRELEEESNLIINRAHFKDAITLKTTGGDSGTPSILFLLKPVEDLGKITVSGMFTGYTFAKITKDADGDYVTTTGVKFRKFNKYPFNQHIDVLTEKGVFVPPTE